MQISDADTVVDNWFENYIVDGKLLISDVWWIWAWCMRWELNSLWLTVIDVKSMFVPMVASPEWYDYEIIDPWEM